MSYSPGRFHGAPLLTGADRHLVSRFSYGVTPPLTARVLALGGARAWFDQQLEPARIADAYVDGLGAWWPSLRRGAQELWQRQEAEVEGGWEVMEDYRRWLLMRRIHTNRPVAEMLTEFWMNHFNVPANGDAAFTHRFSYDQTIRSRALGRFDDLLFHVITHPAMGIYLDNATSSAAHPNENLGRELLELHTVGRGTYDEADVKDSARILTGWQVDMWRTWVAAYKPAKHATGRVNVIGFSDPNVALDGRELTRRYLTYLAHHPATATRICRKLAVKFVNDTPSAAMVKRLADIYLAHNTEIKPVLRALVKEAEFLAARGAKVRDPGEDVVATYRALQVKLAAPAAADSETAADAILWQTSSLGAAPCSWPRADGQPIDNESWSTPARVMAALDLHYVMSGGWWPTVGITYRTPAQWLPVSRRVTKVRRRRRKRGKKRWVWVTTKVTVREHRFDVVVDHLCQQLLGMSSTAAILQACCESVGLTAASMVGPTSDVVKWNFPRVLTTVLDTPQHFTR